jgi:seryl-tRNA synthetase
MLMHAAAPWKDQLFIDCGALGLFGRSAAFESIVDGIDRLVVELGRTPDTTVVRFPPVIPRWIVDRAGFQHSFPHLLGTVHALPLEAHADAARQPDTTHWDDLYAKTDAVLTPAACYPVYASADPHIPPEGYTVDVWSYCYRHEPSTEPSRLRSFRMHEFVRIGRPEIVSDWHARMKALSGEVLRTLGLEPELLPASDPFFGRAARLLKSSQKEQNLKFEQVAPVTDELHAAIASINYHREHFGEVFELRTHDGETAHSACVGFGLERIALAMLYKHGEDVERWPGALRDRLWRS